MGNERPIEPPEDVDGQMQAGLDVMRRGQADAEAERARVRTIAEVEGEIPNCQDADNGEVDNGQRVVQRDAGRGGECRERADEWHRQERATSGSALDHGNEARGCALHAGTAFRNRHGFCLRAWVRAREYA